MGYFNLVYDCTGAVLRHSLLGFAYAATVPNYETMVGSVMGLLAQRQKGVSLYFGRMKGIRLEFMQPMPLYEVHLSGQLIAVGVQLFSVNPELEQVASELFETKARMLSSAAFAAPDSLRLLHLTRRPLVVSLRLPGVVAELAELADIADEMICASLSRTYYP